MLFPRITPTSPALLIPGPILALGLSLTARLVLAEEQALRYRSQYTSRFNHRYACQLLGQTTRRGGRVTLSTQGNTTSALYPAPQVDLVVLALRSHARAVVKKKCRRAGKPMPKRQQIQEMGS